MSNSILLRPIWPLTPKSRATRGHRRSPSTSNTLLPDCAMEIARLEATVVLPIPRFGPVTSHTYFFPCLGWGKLARRTRKDSEKGSWGLECVQSSSALPLDADSSLLEARMGASTSSDT